MKTTGIIKRTAYNYKPGKLPVVKGEHMTEPGQATPIEEMVRRANAGIPIHQDARLTWEDVDDMMPRIKDLTDLDELGKKLALLRQRIAKKEKEVKDQKKMQENASEDTSEANNEETDGVN